MTTQAIEPFNVTNLDLSGISEDELKREEKPRYIYKPGVYNLQVVEARKTKDFKDGAGKLWGGLNLKVMDSESGRFAWGYVAIPQESLLYTAKNGKTNKTKTAIFCDFVESLTGSRPAISNVAESVANLPAVLEGGMLRAKIGYSGDYVEYLSKDEQTGELQFGITLSDSSRMIDSDGNPLTFSSREEAVNYYKSIHNREPATRMSIVGFRRRAQPTQG